VKFSLKIDDENAYKKGVCFDLARKDVKIGGQISAGKISLLALQFTVCGQGDGLFDKKLKQRKIKCRSKASIKKWLAKKSLVLYRQQNTVDFEDYKQSIKVDFDQLDQLFFTDLKTVHNKLMWMTKSKTSFEDNIFGGVLGDFQKNR